MKNPLLPLLLFLAACTTPSKTYHTQPVKPPSLAQISAKVDDAKASTARAKAHSDNITLAASGLRSNSQRIDDKATVVLKWLNQP